MVITWLPKREMTSTSLDRQKGQRTPCADIFLPPCGGDSGLDISLPPCGGDSGLDISLPPCGGDSELDISLPPCGGGSGWGVTLPTGGHVSPLGEALQHIQRRLVDTSWHGAPPSRIPPGPIDGRVGEPLTDPLLQHAAQVGNAVRQFSLTLEPIDFRAFGPEPLERLTPGLLDGASGFRLAHPASSMQVVIPLFLQHFLEPAAQHLDVAVDELLDHDRERAVEHGVRRDEQRPVRPGPVEIRHVRVGSLVPPVRRAELSQRAVENAAVSNIVESHRGRRDVRFKAWRGDAPLRVPHPQQLLVVRETLDEQVETQVSDSPGPQSRMTASRGTIIISTHRSSS